MAHLDAAVQRRHEYARVLVDLDDRPTFRPDHLEQPVRAILPREDALLDTWRQAGRVGQDPDLDEAHRLRLRGVLLRMPRARPERHALDRSGGKRPRGPADVVLVAEQALDDVGQALDVPVRMQRPDGTGDQPVVVEYPHRPEAVVFRVSVGVEREVPPSPEPVAFDVVDLGIAADRDHAISPPGAIPPTVPPLAENAMAALLAPPSQPLSRNIDPAWAGLHVRAVGVLTRCCRAARPVGCATRGARRGRRRRIG